MDLSLFQQFGKKLKNRIENFRFVGFFSLKEAEEKGMRLVTGRSNFATLYWLVDESDGIIADAKFQAFGSISLLAALDVVSELVLRKNYDQASRISADLIDQHLRDKKDCQAFPEECDAYLNQALLCVDDAVHQCLDIPFAATYDTTPILNDFSETPGGIEGWEEFPDEKKLFFIEEVLEKEIRPYVELDAGGVKVEELKKGFEVYISYEGSCTSCYSATGSTLNAIQQILSARLHPSLVVIPVL